MRLKAAKSLEPQPAVAAEEGSTPARHCNFTWAQRIKRVYEVNPQRGPKCGTFVKVISFLDPPQEEIIRRRSSIYGGTRPEDPQALRPWGGAGPRVPEMSSRNELSL